MVFNTYHHTRTCLDEKIEIDEKNMPFGWVLPMEIQEEILAKRQEYYDDISKYVCYVMDPIVDYLENKYNSAIDYNGDYIDHIDIPNLGNAQKNYIRNILEQYYEHYILGDINADSILNIQDIILLVNMILSNEFNSSADLNSDGILNILDVVQVVNIILS